MCTLELRFHFLVACIHHSAILFILTVQRFNLNLSIWQKNRAERCKMCKHRSTVTNFVIILRKSGSWNKEKKAHWRWHGDERNTSKRIENYKGNFLKHCMRRDGCLDINPQIIRWMHFMDFFCLEIYAKFYRDDSWVTRNRLSDHKIIGNTVSTAFQF